MGNNYLHRKWVMRIILFILLLGAVGMTKAMAQTNTYTPASAPIRDTIKAKTVGIIPYSDDFITQEEVMERYYAITSFRMIDTATVAVLTGASDMILVYSLDQNQILHKIQLPMYSRAFDYNNGLFHVVGDRTYLTIDSEGRIHERKNFQQPQMPNDEVFIITDLKVIDGQPVIHECNANTYSITSDGLQEIDTFYYHYARGCKIHPQYIDENSFLVYSETSSRSGRHSVTMESLGLEGKLACLDEINVNDDFMAINLQTSHNRTGRFVKSYLLVVNLNGELVNLVEVPINFISYIHKPFLFKDNAWYYAFSGQEGISIFKINTSTNIVASPDSNGLYEEEIDFSYYEPENETSSEDTNSPTRGNWRTITQAWENAERFRDMEWTPVSGNVSEPCTPITSDLYITTPVSNYNTQIGIPYKYGGFTDWDYYKDMASLGKYTGNRHCYYGHNNCYHNPYQNGSDTYVLGVDCSGFLSRCWELSSHVGTSSIPSSTYTQSLGALTSHFNDGTLRTGDALNQLGNSNCTNVPRHVMMYAYHSSSDAIIVFESSSDGWKVNSNSRSLSYFQGQYYCQFSNGSSTYYYRNYTIQRSNIMKDIILRLNSAITMRQNGSIVTNVTQGEPLTVTYSVKNFGSESWTGYVYLYIKPNDPNVVEPFCINNCESLNPITIAAGGTASFTFSNNGVGSPVGTTKFYVKVKNYNAGGYDRPYDVGDGGYANPLEFQIVPGSGGSCKSCPDYDENWNILSDGVWQTRSSSIGTDGCRIYRVPLISNHSYTFQTCGEGSASFDTRLYLYDASCSEVVSNDDSPICFNNLSSIEYTATNGGIFYLKIDGYSGAGGSFTIAGKRESSIINYVIDVSAIPTSGGTVGGAGTYQSGSTCNLTASPNTGYFFSYWSKNGSQVSTNATYSFTVTENASYEAHFGLNNYTISASASPSAGGAVSGGGSYSYGSSCTLNATPATGYSFVRWTKNGNQVSTNPSYSFTVTENASYVAVFSLNSYTISASASPNAGGSVSGTGSYNYGSTCTLTATPATGYSFVRWTKNGNQVSTNPSYSFTVTENASYVAVFSLNSYTISASANPSAGGTVNGAGTYNYGSSCTLTATPATGYSFVRWTKNGSQVSTNPSYSFTVTGNASYVAIFSLNSFTISASASPSVGGSVSGAGSYNYGSTCTLIATPATGYSFVRWTKNGNQVSTNPSFSFTVTGNASYVAVFEQSPITQNQTLSTGWNWWSSYVELNGAEGLSMLENGLGSAGQMIKSRSDGYVESYTYNGTTGWFGSLTSISNEQMYKINMNSSSSAAVTGYLVSTSNHPIAIGNGWNWIGFPLNQSVGVAEALSGFSPAVDDVLKGRNSYTTYFSNNGTTGWFGSLNTLEPGYGYMYQSQSSGTKTLVFQPGRGEVMLANITPENNIYQPSDQRFADNMTVTAVIEVEDEELRSDSHELAAFVDGECRGSVRLLYVEPIDRYVAFLTVFGETGDALEFRLTDGTDTQFSTDMLSFASDGGVGTLALPKVLHFGTLGLGETSAMVRIYPNPVRRKGTLNVSLPEASGTMTVEIGNMLGVTVLREEVVMDSTSVVRISLPDAVLSGTYILKAIRADGNVYYGKLVVE